jgi:hypothetical protein
MRKRRGANPTERFVWLRFWLTDSPAWRSLSCNARALYIELARRYNGHNNGHISYSLRQASQNLHIGKTAAAVAFQLLQDRGFIACTKKGAFSWKAVRDASEWRLTEYANDFPPEHVTKEFMRWQPPGSESNEFTKSRTRVLRRDRAGPQARPCGSSSKTVDAKNGLHGFSGETVDAEKPPSTGPEARHIQLPGEGRAREGGERSAPEGSAVASEPHEWRAAGYPSGSPTREEHLAALERQAQDRARARSPRQIGGRRR